MITFFVPGRAVPGGSKRAFSIKKAGQYTGRVAIVDSAGQANKDWKAVVKLAAEAAMRGYPPTDVPLLVMMTFYMKRPKYQFGSGKNADKIKDSSPKFHQNMPDALKLMRSTEDAMTGIVWKDDNGNVTVVATKLYADGPLRPGAAIHVREIKSLEDIMPFTVMQ
jgi:Holliday junction resolvase RusA-like endonuclease